MAAPYSDAGALASILDTTGIGIWSWDVVADAVRWSETVRRLFGCSPDAVPHTVADYAALLAVDDRERVTQEVMALLAGARQDYLVEHRVIWPDGSVHWLQCKGFVHRDADGRALSVAGIAFDVTARKEAELEAQRVERLFRAVVEDQTELIVRWKPDGTRTFVNAAYCRAFGAPREKMIGTSFLPLVAPEYREQVIARIGTLTPDAPTSTDRHQSLTADGTLRWQEWTDRALFDGDGKLVELQSVGRDVHDVVVAEDALRESEERLRLIAENIREVVWLRDAPEPRILYVNPAYEAVWGQSCASLYAAPRTFLDRVHPDDRSRVEAAVAGQVEAEQDLEFRLVAPDRSIRWVHVRSLPIRHPDGRVHRVAGAAEDITAQRRAEEQLRQSQKMEAVGQLAGGIAHDFNNILAAIMLQVQLAATTPGVPDDVRASLLDIDQAAGRAATLTRQLLQFSRKQVMQPRRLDVNEVVTNVAKMVQRLLREDVKLELTLHPGALITYADEGMLDQVLMNLAVNARDAMASGGTLRIETGVDEVTTSSRDETDGGPGRYVRLCITDTGTGIAADVLPHIFEPFFTTKEAGRGTGLGLATVFGIVKQHRGAISVSSAVGSGTTFRILLPVSEHVPDEPDVLPPVGRTAGGHETILVVEDDDGVRTLTRRILERHGYAVLEAPTGVEAVRQWEARPGQIHLLLTDIVMPDGVNGRELAAQLRARDRSLKVLLTSGYSRALAGQDIALAVGERFLSKPFGPRDLLDAVRRSLEARA